MRATNRVGWILTFGGAAFLAIGSSRADTFVEPFPVGFVSPDLRFWMEIYPGKQRHATRWRSRAFFYRVERGPDGYTFRKLWSRKLEYGGLIDWERRGEVPSVFIVPGGHAVIMLTQHRHFSFSSRQWREGEVKNAVVIYTGEGKVLKKHKLSELFPLEFREKHFPQSASLVWWLQGTDYYYSRDAQFFALRFKGDKTWRNHPQTGTAVMEAHSTPADRVLRFDLRRGEFLAGDASLLTGDYVGFEPRQPPWVVLGLDTVTDRLEQASGNSVAVPQAPWEAK